MTKYDFNDNTATICKMLLDEYWKEAELFPSDRNITEGIIETLSYVFQDEDFYIVSFRDIDYRQLADFIEVSSNIVGGNFRLFSNVTINEMFSLYFKLNKQAFNEAIDRLKRLIDCIDGYSYID